MLEGIVTMAGTAAFSAGWLGRDCATEDVEMAIVVASMKVLNINFPRTLPAGAGWFVTCEHGAARLLYFLREVFYSGSRPT